MRTVEIGPFQLAERFIGMREVPGTSDNPTILAMLKLDADWPQHDEVPWCSAFVNYIAWLLRLPRSKSLLARSWLSVGVPVYSPEVGDVVILRRAGSDQPDASNVTAAGHVGFFAGIGEGGEMVYLISGNQNNSVTLAGFPERRALGYRRIC